MDWSVKIIIVTSILVQFAAAVLAVQLIFLTKRIMAWTFIAMAILLMAVRRCLTFYGGMLDPSVSTVDLASAVTTLGISISMLVGVALIKPLFLAIDRDKQQLARSREEFQLLVENMPAIVFTGYKDESIRFYDNKVMDITGYPREMFEKHRKKWSDIVLDDDWQKAKTAFIEALGSDLAYVREYRIVHKNGHFVWLQERSRIICDTENNIHHISGVFFDITEKRQIEAKLHEAMASLQNTVNDFEKSENEFKLPIENIPAIPFTGFSDGTVKFFNNKVLEITGYPRETFENKRKKWPDVVVEEDWDKAQKIFIEALKTDMAYFREYRVKNKNGHFVWVQERSRIICDAAGNIDYISGVFFDVTENREIEAALHNAMTKLEDKVTEINHHNQRISLLNEMGELLQSCLTLQEAYQSIAQVVPRLFPDLAGALFIVTPRKSLFLQAVTRWGEIAVAEDVFTLDDCWALRRGGVHLGKNCSSGLVCKHLPASASDYLCVPLIAQGEIIGLIYLQTATGSPLEARPGSENPVLVQSQQLAVTVAKQISMALANLNLRESLHIQAIIDPLTGLYNRRYMEDTLEREIYRGKRRDAPIGIILMDIDYFKRINDTYGHEAGDTLLAAVGGYIKKHIRREDVPCRYGGEEFLLILPDASLENTYNRAEELRHLISKFDVKHLGLSLGKITASFGVAACPDHGENMEDVIRAADAALYLAKSGGRNLTVMANQAMFSPGLPDADLTFSN
jgi:diguanylate cyclase (GGDEF)-like protein/PAS domain S-box-containing protein